VQETIRYSVPHPTLTAGLRKVDRQYDWTQAEIKLALSKFLIVKLRFHIFKTRGVIMCSTSGSAVSTMMIDNDRVKVTEWRFKAKGDNTGWHRHAYDYVVIPLFDGVLEINLGNGEYITAQMQNGVPYYREISVEHDVINGNDFECAFVEVELLNQGQAQ
jgi:hypothetical protein